METDTLEILSLYQYKGRNSSTLSFETVQTAERLLDKLELSAEDERLLQLALKEEQENQDKLRKQNEEILETERREKEMKEQEEKNRMVCVPATGFPSLRNRRLTTPRKDMIVTLSVQDPLGQGEKGLCTSAEEHQPTKSRYSYFVEEVDSEDEAEHDNQFPSPKPKRTVKPTRARTVRAEIYGALNCGVYPLQRQPTIGSASAAPKVVNFEKYRMDNSMLLSKSPSDKKDKLYKNISSGTNSSTELIRGQSSSLKSQHSSAVGSEASTPDHSSIKRKHSAATTIRNKDSAAVSPLHIFHTNTVSNKSDGESVVSLTKDTPTKDRGKSLQRKKTTFSLRNFFRSPRNTKRKDSLHSGESTEDVNAMSATNSTNTSADTSVDTLVANSPSPKGAINDGTKTFRKYIFPTPIIPLESIPSQQELQTGAQRKNTNSKHFRSLSDHYGLKTTPASHSSSSSSTSTSQPLSRPQLGPRKLSLDSRHNLGPVSHFGSPKKGENEISAVAAGSAYHHSSPSTQHRRNNIANLDQSARKLHDACNSGNREACLLYGMALRHGYGVIPDYKESLHYLFAATGLKSEQHDVLDLNIDPFELEHGHKIPELAPEPEAPALYEIALAYLKAYGTDHEDEAKGLKYLEKAASLSHLDAMCLSGTIWSKRSSVRKKDLARAAAWFRIAEKRGAHLIGADWIYKDKYVKYPKGYEG
ncbi:DSF2 (YBR007C) [Zygosaccharomyces parabailii]|nr:DSF2 (YBR007C) [Zygosaccharomyces parabailii]CDH10341.1 uncharacterized protein ZBAI_02126 [Zygosaccharomyces bailii ISA1307]